MPDYIMPHWSKHRDKDISLVPRKYLEWLQEQDWIDNHPELEEAIVVEFAQRVRSYETF